MKEKLRRYFYYYRKEICIFGSCCLVILIGLVCLIPKSKASSGEIQEEITQATFETPKIEQTTPEVIRVDIKGAVSSPGVYEMREGSRVNDVIYQAGGTLENADLSRINLSKHVTDEMVIIIYTKEQIAALNEAQTKIEYVYVEPECTCPDSINDACMESSQENELPSSSQKISINTATQEQLETLPGIGASKAKTIIEYRTKKPFSSIEELKEIKGIGDALFEKIKEQITL